MTKPAALTQEEWVRRTQSKLEQLDRRPIASRALKGTIDPFWSTGLPRVKIDGENFVRTQGYPWNPTGGWTPAPGQRVYLVPENPDGFVIAGPVTETMKLGRMFDLILGNFGAPSAGGVSAQYDTNWHKASVGQTTDGINLMAGLWKYTTSPGAVDNQFGQLPDPRFYPDKQYTFAVSANQTIGRTQIRPDGSIWYINSAGGSGAGAYQALGQARWPAPGVANWQQIKPYGDTTGPAWAAPTITGTAYWWIDAWGFLWLSGALTSSVAITASDVGLIVPNGAWTFMWGQNLVTYKTGGVPIGIGTPVPSQTSVLNMVIKRGAALGLGAGESMGLDGIVLRTTQAENLTTWSNFSLINGWIRYDTISYPIPSLTYRGDLLVERGLVRGGSANNANILQLAVGNRPLSQAVPGSAGIINPTFSADQVGRLDTHGDGTQNAAVGTNQWVSLDNHMWIPEQ